MPPASCPTLLYDMAISAKLIASHTTRAGLADILGSTGEENVQGEIVQRLDRFAELTIYRMNDHTRRLAAMASEEVEDFIPIPEQFGGGRDGKYVLIYDPLDGSSNIDCNVSVGTIFAIYRRKSPIGECGTLEDCLQPGRNLAAAGYIIYGSSTMMVYSAGQGVHGFTLDPHIGEFLLSHPNIQVPPNPNITVSTRAMNGSGRQGCSAIRAGCREKMRRARGLSLRYIGSLVADFHRNLLDGGVYYYPADIKDPAKPQGKLRLLCEANPLASWSSKRAAMPRMGGSGSWTSSRQASTNVCRSTSAAAIWWKRPSSLSARWMGVAGANPKNEPRLEDVLSVGL